MKVPPQLFQSKVPTIQSNHNIYKSIINSIYLKMVKSLKKVQSIKENDSKQPENILPGINLPKITPEIQEKMNKLKQKLDTYKEKVLEKFDKYITGISLLPPPTPKQGEQINKDEIHIFTLVDDSDVKQMSKSELINRLIDITNKISADIDKNIKPQVMLISEVKEACFDGKWELIKMIASSGIIFDKGLLSALKASELHKTMAVQKFEKYVVSYIAVGSLFRGDANPNDIDVAIVIDDTDVKKMSRYELKDKLRAIIQNMGFEVSQITGVKAQFHIQTYILTDFWESLRDANPVIFTMLRDGVPLYDRGVFMPWKLLLQMGRIKPSPEAIDMNMEVGDKLLVRTKQKLLSVVGEDLYYAMLNPAQAALMLYGIPPPTHKETAPLLEEIFVKKEKILEKKYVDMLVRAVKYFKDIEHGKVKEVTGKDIDDLLKDAEDYLKRINKLFDEIEKKREKENVFEIYKTCISITRDLLANIGIKNITEAKLVQSFKENIIDKEKVPEFYLKTLEAVIKAKKDYDNNKITRQEINKVHKDARSFITMMVEHLQRKRLSELEKVKIRFRQGDKLGELILIDNIAFIIPNIENKAEIQKCALEKDGSLSTPQKSSLEELEKHINNLNLPQKIFIKDKIFQSLHLILGKDIEILIGY